jgi:hypothetical protein
MGLAERVAAGDQRHGSSSFIAMRAKVSRISRAAGYRIGYSVRAFGFT